VIAAVGIGLGSIIVAAISVLAAGAAWKLRNHALFRGSLRAQRVHNPYVLSFLGRGLPIVELVLAASYLLALLWPAPSPLTLGLGIAGSVFGTMLLGWAIRGYREFYGTPCGCTSATDRFGVRTILRAGTVAAAGPATVVLYTQDVGTTVRHASDELAWVTFTLVGGAALAAALAGFSRGPDSRPT